MHGLLRARSRGQSMTIFVLAMLLVVLMVSLTLSFSMKVRERIEVQTVADAAAYTNAVATARTMNNIAVLNRTQIAHAVAQAGAQSIISWTTLYRAHLNASRSSFGGAKWPYQIAQLGCLCPWSSTCRRLCRCGNKGVRDLNLLQRAYRMEDQRVEAIFLGADARAALQVFLHQVAQLAIYASQQEVYRDLSDSLHDQDFTREIANAAAPGPTRGEWLTPGGVTTNRSELRGGAMCTDTGAMCELPLSVAHAVTAASGSRGYRFVTHRAQEHYLPHMVRILALAFLNARSIAIAQGEGTTYFNRPARNFTMAAIMNMIPPYAPAISGVDLGTVDTIYMHILNGGGLPCPPVFPGTPQWAWSEVAASGTSFVHRWTGGSDRIPFVHFLVPCTGGLSSCPGIWPAFIDYNARAVVDEDDNFGQPKNFALVQRDLGQRTVPDPWNFFMRFRFEPSNDGRFDNRGLVLADGTPNRMQTALSTGIAYYHRGESLGFNHWNEPPNLLNPYWRATLVAADIDSDGLNDARDTLRNNGAPVAADTFEALRGVGFRGIQ
ncbi:Tad domain-containing protein [Pyxidicoccus trucidator]|uniref:Tad domain-containing protein n=1 Tax=Pyxidicoccus trucidator TaxID=2709662 RepID=UPI0013DC4D7E|nr:Tad domain-containing protein [Pyxidicoccus trucidator]